MAASSTQHPKRELIKNLASTTKKLALAIRRLVTTKDRIEQALGCSLAEGNRSGEKRSSSDAEILADQDATVLDLIDSVESLINPQHLPLCDQRRTMFGVKGWSAALVEGMFKLRSALDAMIDRLGWWPSIENHHWHVRNKVTWQPDQISPYRTAHVSLRPAAYCGITEADAQSIEDAHSLIQSALDESRPGRQGTPIQKAARACIGWHQEHYGSLPKRMNYDGFFEAHPEHRVGRNELRSAVSRERRGIVSD